MMLNSCSTVKDIQTTHSQDVTDKGRFVELEGTYNTREFGGYPGADGQHVRYGLLYRSDDLAELTDKDVAALEALGIKTFIDFRSSPVQAETPDRLPTGAEFHSLAIKVGNIHDAKIAAQDDGPEFMRETSRMLVTGPQKQYREFFRIIAGSDKLPVLFHCSAGKDRTGFAAALFLSALGTPRELIYHDYLLSAQNITEKYADLLAENPAMEPLITVRRDYLEAAFDEIEKKFGSVDNYLVTYLNIDIEKLREIYLE